MVLAFGFSFSVLLTPLKSDLIFEEDDLNSIINSFLSIN